ncbi:HEAT repeat domain-containing protein, partial [Planctomycetota bacterium]
SNSKYAQEAHKFIGDQKQTAYIKRLIKKVRNPESRNRGSMLKCLGSIRSPLVISSLREIIDSETESDEIRIMAVNALANFQDNYVASIFETMAADAGIPANIRKVIIARRDEIMKRLTMNNGDKRK